MKKLYTFSLAEQAQAGLLKELLENEGIACLIKNQQLFAALGEIPFLECAPELWVVDDDVWPRAKSLFDGWMKDETIKAPWVCSGCSETLEGQFESCWKCGKEKSIDD